MGQVSEAGATNLWNLTCDWVGTSAAVELREFSALWAHHLGGSLFSRGGSRCWVDGEA